MNQSPTRVLLTLTGVCVAMCIAACGADDTAGSTPDPEPTATSAVESASTPAAEPLSIADHVLTADALPGLEPQGPAREEDLRAFAKTHDKPVAELRESGFVSGSSVFFSGKGQDFAVSIAAQYADTAAADAEAERLYASNTEGDPAIDVSPLEVPGVPDVRAASLEGAQGGKHYTGVEIVFVDGTVLHEVFAIGETERFDLDAVLSSVAGLYQKVEGHPLG